MELDLVAAVAVAVEEAQLRRVHIGQPAVLDPLGAADLGAARRQPVVRPAGAFAPGGFLQGQVAAVGVVVFQRAGLVDDFVRRHQGGVFGIHKGLRNGTKQLLA
jgi:hypothetical protein